MKLRNVLAGAVGAVGLTALSNRVLASKADDLDPALPVGDQETYRWRGFDIGYTEAGDPDDPDLVAFHGVNAAASSHEFRPIVGHLAEDYHVLVPDLPGFGHSDRPPLLYSASLYETFVADFLADTSEDATVVASGLTGSYAAGAAREADVDSLVLACPTDHSMGDRSVLRRSLLRSPLVGEALFNIVVSKRSMRYFHADHGYYDMDNLTEETLDYEWQSGHQPGARFAPASFVSGFLDPEEDLADVLASLAVETTLVWGRDASVTPLSFGRELADAGNARLIVFDEAKLLPYVEHPEQFVAVVGGEYDDVEGDGWGTHEDVDEAVDIEIDGEE
ncbi:alpha/beta fold hydrolase [Halapricum sp. CBA1109]|uniref:alpha/beta fold hydrolase n=1 Tax=Halapricum sp. CBA1109 TaxID=2668068 RepID=UPI0012FB6A77|nr:alpha/beta hydrolase [Halapricum sp. CBA1109]MUV89642.1 alpha/beta fold hydrolase [Halapricum sp. CBA1109]